LVINNLCGWHGQLRRQQHSPSIRTSLYVTDDAGETNVWLVVDLDSRERAAVLIEEKINANFQPAQAYRYRERGKQGCSSQSNSL
jgi:hypothetical protein